MHLEMVKQVNEPFRFPVPEPYHGKILTYSQEPLSSTSGIIRFIAKPGDLVHPGQPVAKIYSTFGKLLDGPCAPRGDRAWPF